MQTHGVPLALHACCCFMALPAGSLPRQCPLSGGGEPAVAPLVVLLLHNWCCLGALWRLWTSSGDIGGLFLLDRSRVTVAGSSKLVTRS